MKRHNKNPSPLLQNSARRLRRSPGSRSLRREGGGRPHAQGQARPVSPHPAPSDFSRWNISKCMLFGDADLYLEHFQCPCRWWHSQPFHVRLVQASMLTCPQHGCEDTVSSVSAGGGAAHSWGHRGSPWRCCSRCRPGGTSSPASLQGGLREGETEAATPSSHPSGLSLPSIPPTCQENYLGPLSPAVILSPLANQPPGKTKVKRSPASSLGRGP